ncbi:MAG TPA: TIGR01777 family oxidoreductase [Chitinophagaceae bacterium]|nr:TIGR01777 family oxidoreductase [Chitinophagaceae bacterium]
MAVILLTGATGLIGQALTELLLQQNHEVYILSTRKKKSFTGKKHVQYVFWDTQTKQIDPSFQLSCDTLINLAGAGIADKRWTPGRKAELRSSRLNALHTLQLALSTGQLSTRHLISASAIGYYATGDELHTEEDGPGKGFLSQVCSDWEAAAIQCAAGNCKLSMVRIGIVFSNQGGALGELKRSLLWKVAALPGNGEQYMPWIHIQDLCRLFLFLHQNQLEGVWNGVAPERITLGKVMQLLSLYYRKAWIWMKIPPRIMYWMLGEMAGALLESQQISAQKTINAGFEFRFPEAAKAIEQLCSQPDH